MAASVKPWIQAIIQHHDAVHGADLAIVHTDKALLCQLNKFTSHTAPITAIVSDSAHRVAVTFDPEATAKFEQSIGGECPERLHSHTRAIISIRSCRIQLRPTTRRRNDSPLYNVPRVELYLLDWRVVTGDRFDPEYFPTAVEIGRGEGDEVVREILLKWWSGESKSQEEGKELPGIQSFVDTSLVALEESELKVEAPDARSQALFTALSVKLDSKSFDQPAGTFIPVASAMSTYLDFTDEVLPRYMAAPGSSKKVKTKRLPEVFFEPPPVDQQRLLDEITVFGINLSEESHSVPQESLEESRSLLQESLDDESRSLPNGSHSTQSNGTSNGHSQSLQPATQASAASQPPLQSLRQSQSAEFSSPARPVLQDIPRSARPPPPLPPLENASDDDDDIPVKPVRAAVEGGRRSAFKPAAPAPQSSQIMSDDSAGETDEDALSEYERSVRQAKRAPKPDAAAPSEESSGGRNVAMASHDTTESSGGGNTAFIAKTEEESIPQSQDSSGFRLSRFSGTPSHPAPETQAEEDTESSERRVLVPTTDESDPRGQVQVATQSSPAVPARAVQNSTPARPVKRPRTSTATNASADADDERAERRSHDVEPRLAKKSRTSEPTPSRKTPFVVDTPARARNSATPRTPYTPHSVRPTTPASPYIDLPRKLNGWTPDLTVIGGLRVGEVRKLAADAKREKERLLGVKFEK